MIRWPVGDGKTASDELIAVEGVGGESRSSAHRRLCPMLGRDLMVPISEPIIPGTRR